LRKYRVSQFPSGYPGSNPGAGAYFSVKMAWPKREQEWELDLIIVAGVLVFGYALTSANIIYYGMAIIFLGTALSIKSNLNKKERRKIQKHLKRIEEKLDDLIKK